MQKKQIIGRPKIKLAPVDGGTIRLVRAQIKCPVGEHIVSIKWNAGVFEMERMKSDEVWKCDQHSVS
jgi:hypothetical protein